MLTDKQIEALYAQIRWRIDAVNDEYLQTVGEQINAIGKLNPSSIRKLAQMRKYGANSAKIKKKLQEALNMSADEVQGILNQAAKEEYKNYDFLGIQRGRSPIPIQYNYSLQTFIKAVAAQTAETFQNYSNTTSIDEEYKEVVSQAVDAVARGVTDYNQAIRASMRKLGGDGLRVTYESGLHRRMDTAIRMNILDSVRQVSMQAAKMAGEEIGADGVELSAHPYSALDHEDIQGRMYDMENYQKMQTEQPFEDVDGHHYKAIRRPITQWNCRHFASPILLGISQRRYTDEQLSQWKRNNHAGCEISGEHYTIYQASQLMRRLETEVRKQKDIANLAKASGDDVLRREAQANIVKLKAKYNAVAEQANLKARPEKMVVESYTKKGRGKYPKKVENESGNGIIKTEDMNAENRAKLKEKITSGEFPLKTKIGAQKKHIPGTNEYKGELQGRIEKGKDPQSVLTIPIEDVDEIIKKYNCTGTVSISDKKYREFTDTDRIVGKCIIDGILQDTKRIAIHYSKKGAHIVPVKEVYNK